MVQLISVLVNKAVTGVVPDHLDRHIQLVFALYAIAQDGHLSPRSMASVHINMEILV